ncbi:response regulator transcription factor [Raoultibacter timonensis]|uniref:response regulator transcription factor n=1 Tax=Raoultibacter timonensis TaxID=1907662 RepID=UPI0026DC449A|nr:helix-turn-helix transcriptional regulator [Raoultibacter timonensis]
MSNEAQLTEREKEVLREAMHGYSIDNIAKHLNLSSQTIKTYLSRSYSRLGVASKQAVLELLDSDKTM